MIPLALGQTLNSKIYFKVKQDVAMGLKFKESKRVVTIGLSIKNSFDVIPKGVFTYLVCTFAFPKLNANRKRMRKREVATRL